MVHLRGGLDHSVAPAVLAKGLARQLEGTEVPPAIGPVDARGECEGWFTTTSSSVVLATVVVAATGAAE